MARLSESNPLNTLEKCVQILTLLSESPPLQVAEIARELDLPRSTAYRYIAALRSHHLVEEAADGPGYRLGTKILELAATMSRRPIRGVALPYMERIARETGETVILCGLREREGICLEKVDGHHALRVSYELGDTYPLHASATGKAILAHLDPDERRSIVKKGGLARLTETTITDPSALDREVAKIRSDGYSESDGEAIVGTRGIAAPIFSFADRVVASIGVSVPRHRGEGELKQRLIDLLAQAAQDITREIAA
jgi:DNA-binding IclR family transcriptional regulator